MQTTTDSIVNFEAPRRSRAELSPVGIEDKLVLGTIYGAEIWILDHSMTWLATQTLSLNLFAQAILLLGMFFFALCAPFWMARKLFDWSSWTGLRHDIGDRIVVVLFGVSLPLAFDTLVLHWVGPTNILMTFLYGLVSVFGVVAADRPSAAAEGADDAVTLTRKRNLWIIRNAFFLVIVVLQLFRLFLGFAKMNHWSGRVIAYAALLVVGICVTGVLLVISLKSRKD